MLIFTAQTSCAMNTETPTLQTWLEQARLLIAEDRLDEVLSMLRPMLENSPQLDEVLQQSGRFAAIRKQIRLGTVSQAEANLTQNQIRAALLELLSEIEAQQAAAPALGEEMVRAISVMNPQGIVVNSSIQASGDLHIGDKQITQNAEKIYNIDNIDNANFS
ncbi:MAG TPA: hypothetical protein PKC76_15835 [Saprospiraceae bacterium]|nr:hypothetical protein [Saprospiraceae bacterium]HMP25604.1 hypothetical protein [Saprospiraceae bacterium]